MLKRSPIVRRKKPPREKRIGIPLFPRPNDIKHEPVTVRVHRDGREVCNMLTAAGKVEYGRRIALMAERQKNICCLFGFVKECPGSLLGYHPTFEHENGRGGGKQDDRVEVDGHWLNGAAHLLCNHIKGSRYIPYNAGKPSGLPHG